MMSEEERREEAHHVIKKIDEVVGTSNLLRNEDLAGSKPFFFRASLEVIAEIGCIVGDWQYLDSLNLVITEAEIEARRKSDDKTEKLMGMIFEASIGKSIEPLLLATVHLTFERHIGRMIEWLDVHNHPGVAAKISADVNSISKAFDDRDVDRVSELLWPMHDFIERLLIMLTGEEPKTRDDSKWPIAKLAAQMAGITETRMSELVGQGEGKPFRTNGKSGKARRIDPESIAVFRREKESRERAGDGNWANGGG